MNLLPSTHTQLEMSKWYAESYISSKRHNNVLICHRYTAAECDENSWWKKNRPTTMTNFPKILISKLIFFSFSVSLLSLPPFLQNGFNTLSLHNVYRRCLSTIYIAAVSPWCFSLLCLHTGFPHCLSTLSLHNVSQNCLSTLSLQNVSQNCLSTMSLRTVSLHCLHIASLQCLYTLCLCNMYTGRHCLSTIRLTVHTVSYNMYNCTNCLSTIRLSVHTVCISTMFLCTVYGQLFYKHCLPTLFLHAVSPHPF